MIDFRRIPLPWAAASVAAAWWVACGGVFAYVVLNNRAPTRFVSYVVPETIASHIWSWPWPWALLAPLSLGVVVFVAYLLLGRVITGDRAASNAVRFLGLWFAAAAASFIATVPWAIGVIVANFPPSRVAFVLDAAGEMLLLSAYWGIVWGWLPALFAVRHRAQSGERAATPSTAGSRRRRAGRPPVVVVLVVALLVATVAAGFTVRYGERAGRAQSLADDALANGHTLGSLPDPDAEIEPPPTIAPQPVDADPSWCAPDSVILLLGDQDSATGHRVLTIQANNVGTEPCVLDGYPDIAFADGQGSELEVSVAHGGGFLATDPGAVPITIPPRGYAVTSLAWDAMPTNDVRVAYELHAAAYAGLPRGSWPITLDIAEGGSVAVTAWALDTEVPVQ